MKAYPPVYIIILNWNGWQDTVECLDSLKKATYKNFYVVVVDNASRDDSVDRLRLWASDNGIPINEYDLEDRNAEPLKKRDEKELPEGFRKLHLICSRVNLGFCAGNNVGMDFAVKNGAEYLLILNNDTICEPDFIEPLVKIAEMKKDIGLAGGLICYAEARDIVQSAGGRFDFILEASLIGDFQPLDEFLKGRPEYYETDWVSGCMTLMPARVYNAVGGYNEVFFIWSEDCDLSLRVRCYGYKLYVALGSKIYHKAGMSLGRITPMTHYYANRNRLLLKKLHLRGIKKFFFYLWYIASRIVRWTEFAIKGRFDLISAGIDAILDHLKGRYGKWSKHAG